MSNKDWDSLVRFPAYIAISAVLRRMEEGVAYEEIAIILADLDNMDELGGEPGAVVRFIANSVLGDSEKAESALRILVSSKSDFFREQARTLQWVRQLWSSDVKSEHVSHSAFPAEFEDPFWAAVECILKMHDQARDQMYVAQYIARLAKQMLALRVLIPGLERTALVNRLRSLPSDRLSWPDGSDIPL